MSVVYGWAAYRAQFVMRLFTERKRNSSLIGRESTMTSPSRYTSTLRFDVAGTTPGEHLSDNDVTTGNPPLTSSRGSSSERPVVVTRRQRSAVAYVRLSPTPAPNVTPGLINGLETVPPSSEPNNNHHQQQQQRCKVIPRTVSVPASVHSDLDLECSRSPREGEGHRRSFAADVKLTLLRPTTRE